MVSKIKLYISEFIHKLNYSFLFQKRLADAEILAAVKSNGYYVIPDFLSAQECEDLRKKADDFLEKNPDKVKLESNGYDIRVYGVDRYSNSFNIEKFLSFSYRLFSKFSWAKKPEHFLLLGKIISGENNLGSGSGWHRDSPLRHQFKTLLYLSDVTIDNGPFQYIKGSHSFDKIGTTAEFLKKELNERRFTDVEIETAIESKIIPEPTTFLSNAGTLLVIDTRGLHRGMPLKSNNRYALTNYHFQNGVNQRFFQTK